MRNCAVESCSNNPLRNPELSFFGLPKDSCVRDEWMEVLDLRDTEISEYIRVCELHFKAKDFCAGKKQLKHHAIPVLRLGRGKSIVGYNSDEEFAECNSDSDPEIVEIKKISREMSAAKPMDEMRIEDDEHKKEEDVVTESESGRRPSRRAARLAAEKIYNTVRQYGLADGVVKKELKFKERSEWHAVRAPPPNIDLLMECHEELLSAAQAEALLKSQLEYNMVVKTLRSLKAANARIVYTLGDESETPESNSAVTPKISSESSSALVSKQPSIVTLTTSRTVSGNELQQSTVVPKKNPVVPVKLAAASQQPLSSVVPTPSSLQTTPVYVGQPQTAIQLIQTVPQTPTILITTTNAPKNPSKSGSCCVVPSCKERCNGHTFPKDGARKRKWLLAIRRKNFKPTPHSRVCRKHFKEDDYIIQPEAPKESVSKIKPCRRLKPTAVPSIFSWT